jgi:uncharacterized membrane protein YeiH
MINFLDIIEYAGTFAFAISGIRLASLKQFDWFGAYVVGLVTAIGGGTIRDVLLGVTPFWMMNSSYLIWTAVALFFVVVSGNHLTRFANTFFLFDTIGLGLFVVVGFEKTINSGFPYWVAIVMGTITGAAGGIMRDILITQIPLIFRKEIYAMACVIGGLVYWLCDLLNVDVTVAEILSASSVIITRVIAVKFQIGLPVLKSSNNLDES